MRKKIKYTTYTNESDQYQVEHEIIVCHMMNTGQHSTVENPIPFCVGCGMLQRCKPWEKMRDYSRSDFEDYLNMAELIEGLEAANE